MLKISHIKILPIIFVLFLLFAVAEACYMPGGVFLVSPQKEHVSLNDSICLSLPIDFQMYNYFKVTYLKNKEVFEGEKINDSTIVIILRDRVEVVEKIEFRVEAGIVPFFEKKD